MIHQEDQCVGCETCTLGNGCPLKNVTVITCDRCGDDAVCRIDDSDYCADCANEYLDQVFEESFTIQEKSDLLGCSYHDL